MAEDMEAVVTHIEKRLTQPGAFRLDDEQHIRALLSERRKLVEALILFREFTLRNATRWELGAGHHHPIWAHVAELLPDHAKPASGPEWAFIQSKNTQPLAALSARAAFDIEAIKKAAYQEGWNEREDDFLIGAARMSPTPGERDAPFTADDLAQEIRRVDGNNSLGAGALAEALMPFLSRPTPGEGGAPVAWEFWVGPNRHIVKATGPLPPHETARALVYDRPTPGEGDARLCPCGKPSLPTASICSDCADACLASGEAPVARRILWGPGEDWDFSNEADDPLTDADVERLRAQGYVVDRLYTRPTPATPEGLREAVEAAFKAGWNAHETGYGGDSDGRARAFGAFTVNPALFNDDVLADEDDAALQPQAQETDR